jgi:hypothetical protein
MPFDPCREWLGIDAVDLASPHVVLGVGPDESNPLVIARAADQRLQALAAVTPGPFEKAHTALLNRVTEARDQMLDAAARRPPAPSFAPIVPSLSPPPPPPRAGGLSAPPPPGGRPPVPPVVPMPVPPLPVPPSLASPVPMVPDLMPSGPLVPEPAVPPPLLAGMAPPPVPPPVPSFGESALMPGDAGAAGSRGMRPAAPTSSGSGTVFAAMALLAAIASGLGAYIYSTRGHHKVATHHAAANGAGHTDAKHAADAKHHDPKQAAGDHGGKNPSPDAEATPPKDRPSADGDEDAKKAERRREERRRQAEEESRRERERREREAAEKARAAKERAAAEMAAREKAEQEAREKADREEEERMEKERALAATKVDESLRKAFASLREDNYDAALKAVDTAIDAAGDDGDLVTRAERWRLLVNYAKQLAGFRNEAFASANEGREYEIGGRVVSIIEINSSTFAFKEAGQIRRGSRGSLPKAIERAILKQWFENDGRAANHIFLGVQHLVDDPPNLRGVRTEWETALKGEPATKSLMPLLDDPILGGGG